MNLVRIIFFTIATVFINTLCCFPLHASKYKTSKDQWQKTYEKFKDRSTENPDSCVKAANVWLDEVTRTGDAGWKSKALCMLGKSQYYANKLDETESTMQAALQLEEEINNQEVIGIANYYLATLRYEAKKYEEAVPYFKRSVAALSVTSERWTEANCRFIYGYVLYTQKKIEASREQLTQAAVLFEYYVDTKVKADTYNYLGDLEYYVAEKFEAAVEAYKKAAPVYTAVGKNEDAAFANLVIGEIYYYYLNDNNSAYEFYKKAYEFYSNSTNTKKIATVGKALGDICNSLQLFDEATGYLLNAAEANNKLELYLKEGDCYIVLANIYYFAGNYPNALKYYRSSLATFEKANSIGGQAGSYVGLGNFYQSRKDYEKAFEMFTKSVDLYKSQEKINYSGLSSAYVGLGNYYDNKGDFENSLKYYLLSIESEEKGDKEENDRSVAYMNIANIYMARDDDENTEKYLKLAIEEADRTGNKHRQGSALKLRGFYYNRKKESQKALDDCSAALKIIEKLGLLPEEMECYRCLYNASYNLEKYQDAVGYYSSYISARDSINNEKRNTEINKRELQHEYQLKENQLKLEEERKQFALQEEIKRKQLFFEFEAKQARYRAAVEKKEIAFREEMKRKQLALEYQEEQDSTKLVTAKKELGLKQSIQAEQLRNDEQRRLNNWLFGGLAIFGLLMLIILKGYADKRKANKIIIKQKEETEQQKEIIELKGLQLEEKNREIIDSINYARRLQEAILPPHKLVKQNLDNYFILYKPRDIVAGDFYWMEKVAATGEILFAVADCTGHGVPGAMVSVVCSGALNRAVKEFHLTDPGLILDKVRELVLETFEKSESEVKDGMDIGLCLLDLNKLELKWAGANNPLWIVKKSVIENPLAETAEVMEIKANKQPIGATENPKPFTTTTLKLDKGDILYMSTDGYADQFGGNKGKKFKDSNMKKLLLDICTKPMEDQTALLDEAIETWKGGLEQVDDICVAGVKI